MRIVRMILGDMKIQAKCGFYLLYGILSVIYLCIISALPESVNEKIAIILIFSDPGAMGLFFMGAIILLEKSQRVTFFYAVSSVRPGEYVLSKVVSLAIIGEIVAVILAFAAKMDHLGSVMIGTLFASIIFTLCGLIVATKISSINQFVLGTTPIEIIGFVPAIAYLFGYQPKGSEWYPFNQCIDIILGNEISLLEMVEMILFIFCLALIANRCVKSMFRNVGGVKL